MAWSCSSHIDSRRSTGPLKSQGLLLRLPCQRDGRRKGIEYFAVGGRGLRVLERSSISARGETSATYAATAGTRLAHHAAAAGGGRGVRGEHVHLRAEESMTWPLSSCRGM